MLGFIVACNDYRNGIIEEQELIDAAAGLEWSEISNFNNYMKAGVHNTYSDEFYWAEVRRAEP